MPPILKSGKIAAVSFTGSVTNGQIIAREIDPVTTRYQAELGGNNTVIILNDADLDSAADAVIQNGFACSGQWCTGTGRVIIEKQVHDKFVNLLIERIAKLKPGSGLDENSTMGPLITKLQLQRVEDAVAQATKEGAVIAIGGNKSSAAELSNGNFYEPTIIVDVTPGMDISDTEIFGPVIMIMKMESADEALRIVKQSRYGLAFSVYTKNTKTAEKIIAEVESGVCHINLPTTYRDVALPLLGWNNSGIGLPESGRFMQDFFTRTKAIYRG